ncbi:type IV secretion system DNA-binding domain-containing protein, partial [Patescibacteria group bacterium]|nr:type IV secretion system DNA-binding domain-containing protein [Patescibacteria group bacterium]
MVNSNEITVFAETNFRNKKVRFGIKEDDRRRHIYLIGKTGVGKSNCIENMVISDIQRGRGVALVDPHGESVEKVVKYIPSNRVNDVVYFNPSDTEHPIAFNILEEVNPQYKNLIASGLVGVFKKIWADSWGPRLEYILMNTILALLENPGSTLLGITRLLVDKTYRKKIVSNLTDPIVKAFWIDEYANYNERFRTEAISPIQNKVGQFLSSAIIRNIVGQPKSTIDMRNIMDKKKILLMNLAKGRIGEENSALLGAMMITKLQLAAMSRVDIAEEDREDFYLYVDEFQNFSTESFANILSEARKYRLNLTIAHQYIEQLGDVVKAAVFGNVGTIVCFRVGAE